jgi:two-component system cell cycle response regulator
MSSDKDSKSKKQDSSVANPWEKIRQTGTKTEVATSADTRAHELLQQAEKIDPSLIVIQGDLVGRVFRIPLGRMSIGRHATCQIQVSQRLVSTVHAEIRRNEHGVIIEDLNSTNGTLVNKGLLKQPIPLGAGDLIKIGNTVFKYVDKELDSNFSEELHKQMTRDPLTNAFNRAYIMKALSASMDIAKSGYPLSIVLIDLDHFKKINDTHGHIAGDYVLKETCRILQDTVVRADDVLGRYGGEEFIVVMPNCSLQDAVGAAERMRKTLESHPFEFSKAKIPVTASLGVLQWKPKFESNEDFIGACDVLLYQSKNAGRNRVTSSS